MEVTRDVILDLLPVYLMGEASPATRALVEEHLARDPELAARVHANAADVLARTAGALPRLAPDLELRSVVRTRRVFVWMRWLFALACIFTAVGASVRFSIEDGRLTDVGFALSNHPLQLALFLSLGAACWIAYFALKRTLGPARR